MRSSKGSTPLVSSSESEVPPCVKDIAEGSRPITTLLFGSIGGTEDSFDLIGDFIPLLNRH